MRAVPVLLALGADLAWNLAGAFWGFTLLAALVLWVALHQANVTTGSKAYATEQRLNAAMVRIPNPQSSPGIFTGNISYPISAGTANNPGTNGGGAISGSVTHPVGGAPTDHWHDVNGAGAQHGHFYGQIATDFNALRQSFSDLVTAHNGLVTKLQQTKILQ